MGMYTTLCLNCTLKHDTPEDVVKTLYWYCGLGGVPDNNVFRTSSGRNPLNTYQNSCLHYANMHYCGNSWDISTRGAIKNHEGEIEQFLVWLKPYIAEGVGVDDMYAYTIYENDSNPKIYKLR